MVLERRIKNDLFEAKTQISYTFIKVINLGAKKKDGWSTVSWPAAVIVAYPTRGLNESRAGAPLPKRRLLLAARPQSAGKEADDPGPKPPQYVT
jgi:hypothetical protein